MSLTFGAIATVLGARKIFGRESREYYLLGTDAIGAELERSDFKVPVVVKVYAANFLTSVVAGLTVAVILGVAGYTLRKNGVRIPKEVYS